MMCVFSVSEQQGIHTRHSALYFAKINPAHLLFQMKEKMLSQYFRIIAAPEDQGSFNWRNPRRNFAAFKFVLDTKLTQTDTEYMSSR